MAKPVMCSMTPILAVRDLDRALEFYQRVMGFEVGWIAGGEPPTIASVCRDPVDLMLRLEAAPRRSDVYISVEGVDQYFQSVVDAGAKVTVPLADRQYGMRDGTLEDPDGNTLCLGETLVRD